MPVPCGWLYRLYWLLISDGRLGGAWLRLPLRVYLLLMRLPERPLLRSASATPAPDHGIVFLTRIRKTRALDDIGWLWRARCCCGFARVIDALRPLGYCSVLDGRVAIVNPPAYRPQRAVWNLLRGDALRLLAWMGRNSRDEQEAAVDAWPTWPPSPCWR